MARPKKVIDYEAVEKLANIQCTQEEISNFLGISTRTLQRDEEFCRVYKKGLKNGRMSLRRWQFDKAKKGSTSMLIWLGKQYLDQKDDTEAKDKLAKAQTKKIEKEIKIMDSDNGIDDGVEIIDDAPKS